MGRTVLNQEGRDSIALIALELKHRAHVLILDDGAVARVRLRPGRGAR